MAVKDVQEAAAYQSLQLSTSLQGKPVKKLYKAVELSGWIKLLTVNYFFFSLNLTLFTVQWWNILMFPFSFFTYLTILFSLSVLRFLWVIKNIFFFCSLKESRWDQIISFISAILKILFALNFKIVTKCYFSSKHP